MPRQQLIYASRPLSFSLETLSGILTVSRARNAQLDITGSLICRPDIFLQLLEGPTGHVEDVYRSICEDSRHTDVNILVRAKVAERLFQGWHMHHDPEETWLWSPQEISRGDVLKKSAREIRSVFVRKAMTLGS